MAVTCHLLSDFHICTFAQAGGRFAPLHFSSHLHPLHPNTPSGDFFDLVEGDGRGTSQKSGERFGVAFAAGGAAEPGGKYGNAGKVLRTQ